MLWMWKTEQVCGGGPDFLKFECPAGTLSPHASYGISDIQSRIQCSYVLRDVAHKQVHGTWLPGPASFLLCPVSLQKLPF